MKTWFVYVDWTLEEIPRPFYVGKGLMARVKVNGRNKHHTNVAGKYGQRREIVFSTLVENESKEHEKHVVAILHTFVGDPLYNGIGTNYTPGGDGGRMPGWHHSPETCALMSEKVKLHAATHPYTNERRQSMSRALTGKKKTKEHAQKLRVHLRSLNTGENAIKASERGKLSNIDMQQMHEMRDSGMTLQQIADIHHVTRQAIRARLLGKTKRQKN